MMCFERRYCAEGWISLLATHDHAAVDGVETDVVLQLVYLLSHFGHLLAELVYLLVLTARIFLAVKV